jgi:hypothetical protein
MKATHEAQATPISDANAQCVAANYVSIRTIGQAGGIAAQNVNATNITLNSGPVVEPVTQKRQLQALETLWQIVRNLSQEFSQVIFIDSILLANELDDYFRNRPTDSMVNVLCDFEDLSCAPTKLVRAGDYTKERPFVKNRIWSIVFVISAVYGRAGLLITNSYKKNTYQDWRKDSGIDQLLRSILPSNIVQQIQDKKFAGLRTAIDHLENQLLIEAGMQNG